MTAEHAPADQGGAATWAALLDRYAARLDRYRALLDEGADPVAVVAGADAVPLRVPDGLAPPPPELAARAAELVAQGGLLEAALADRSRDLHADLAPRRPRAPREATSRVIDVTG